MDFTNFNNSPPVYIPEFTNTQDAMNDVALRVQQIVVGMDVYKKQLDKVDQLLPGMLATGYETTDLPLWWGVSKRPETLSEGLRKSLTFTFLNAMDMHVYLIDGFLKSIAVKYYGYNADDTSWFNSNMFQMITGIDLSKVQYSEDVDDLRKTCDKLRQFRITRTTNAQEYFDLYSKLNIFIAQLAILVGEHIVKQKKLSDGKEGSDVK